MIPRERERERTSERERAARENLAVNVFQQDTKLKAGTRVQVDGLQSAAHLNARALLMSSDLMLTKKGEQPTFKSSIDAHSGRLAVEMLSALFAACQGRSGLDAHSGRLAADCCGAAGVGGHSG